MPLLLGFENLISYTFFQFLNSMKISSESAKLQALALTPGSKKMYRVEGVEGAIESYFSQAFNLNPRHFEAK